jgi:hypothetical protein
MATHRHPTEYPLAGLRIDLSSTHLSAPLRRVLDRMLEPQPALRFPSERIALEAVDHEQGLEPWQLALEPLRRLDTVVSTERTEDALIVRVGSRTSPARWLGFAALFAVSIGLFFLAMEVGLGNGEVAQFLTTSLNYMPLLLAIYAGTKAVQEFRSRKQAELTVTSRGWSLTQDGPLTFAGDRSGSGKIVLRVDGRSEARTSGLGLPISVRDALALQTESGREYSFGFGLFPVEARAITEAVRVFQQSGETVLVGADGADAVQTEQSEARAGEDSAVSAGLRRR